MQFNTRRFTVAPLPKIRLKVQSVHQHWIANPNISARDLHRLLSMLVFMASLVRRGWLRLRPVQWWAATAWCQRTGNWSNRIQVPQWVLPEVAWWSSPAVLQGLPLVTKETEVTLFTDASSSGWGAQLGSRSTQGQWSASQRSCHINVLEMQAVIYAVRDFLPQLRSRVVRLMCDNAVTVAYIKNEGGTRSHSLMQMTIRLLKWCDICCPSARSAQHPGGFPVQSRPDSDHRVDDGHGESTTFVRQVGRAMDRLVCDIRQQTTRQVRIAVSGPQGGVDRCHVHALGQGEGPLVGVPAIQDGPASTAEDRSVTSSGGDFDRSTATGSIMVPKPDGQDLLTQDVWTADGVTETRHFRPSNLHAWKLSGPSWELRVIPGKLPTWCQGADENLHNKCMNLIGQDSWRFVGRKEVFQVRSHHFSTYMMHLFRDGLLPSTIISHRTSVASVLRHWVYDPAADPHIKLLVRAFRLECPVQRRIMPKWDLHLVLLSLLKPPFTSQSDEDGESSDEVIPLKWRTLKCVFLLALASARRRSYLHALSIAPGRCVFARGNIQRQLMWYLYFRNLASWRRISFRCRPLSGSRYRGLPTWIRRNRRKCYVPWDSWSSTYGTR